MPVIELSEVTYRRLQSHAVPFIDTPETVIIKLLESNAKNMTASNILLTTSPPDRSNARVLPPLNAGDVRHTTVIEARFADHSANNWNALIVIAHKEALTRLGSFDGVRNVTQSSIAPGNRDDRGYHFQSNLGFSIQYVDANNAWRNALHLARQLNVPVEVYFQWRDTDGAAYPGEFGLLKWSPEKKL